MSILGVNRDAISKLMTADQTQNLHEVFKTVLIIIQDYDLTLQQIEKIFRENKGFTHLIARERSNIYSRDVKFISPSDMKILARIREQGGDLPQLAEKTYYLFISTRSEGEAMMEVLEESRSYTENFGKLKDTGFILPAANIPLSNQLRGGFLEREDARTGLRIGFNVQYLNIPLNMFNWVVRFFADFALFLKRVFG